MTLSFAVTFDYRCPFACNLHEHLLAGLDAAADWDVRFVPLCQGQLSIESGQPSVWDDPTRDTGMLALQTGIAVRDQHPDAFRTVHRALFAARHRHGRRIDDRDVVVSVLQAAGLDADDVLARVDDRSALATIRTEHTDAVERYEVFGVPTLIVGDDAVFIRLMEGTDGSDPARSRTTIERLLALSTGWPELNELKHTRVSR